MRRLLAAIAFTFIAGAAMPVLAQSSSPYQSSPAVTQVQYQQPYQPPAYAQERRGGRGDALRIVSAWYGYGRQACDAERAVARNCDGRQSCTVPVTNRLCGDPAPNIVKVLTVEYRCHGRPRSITRGEGGHLGLRCD